MHGDIIVERRTPSVRIGKALVVPPPGGFLQATMAGEDALGGLVTAAVGKAKVVADLFAGVGTLALRLAASGNRAALALGVVGVVGVMGAAEAGRRRANGRAVFSWTSTLLAPAWVAERAVCSWLACWQRLAHGGIRYNGCVLRHAATPRRVLRRRHGRG